MQIEKFSVIFLGKEKQPSKKSKQNPLEIDEAMLLMHPKLPTTPDCTKPVDSLTTE